jgi:DNA-binding XRE family transcriptional regulator
MPNIGTVLREEITRLSRKETRGQIDPTRKATTQHRKDIAALKRQVADLERQVKLLARRSSAAAAVVGASRAAGGPKVRFVAKGLKSQRERLGLSAGDFGRLVGVSAQSIYNWEGGQTRPRDEQVAKLAQLRTVGKREAGERLRQAVKRQPDKPRG